ncbi:MAG TPA: LytTR family DNA-binding domain-containing protein [Candidatus Agrococcus pullicola]|uniref:LytTR family DNA-binding domain-containing protein n=1 Tax=Candidatus Agrococcus pullicola TaxID=2838429 RepID=A0A9D1YVW9_9MICO|nr:LytTR family DNA-binding domain-containing protein [Candidatus Agrococcus pullicola]
MPDAENPTRRRSTLSVAIVEDDDRDRARLGTMLRQYGDDNGLTIRLSEFEDGAAIIEGYQPQYDVIFLDIQMRGIDGMRAAAAIREVDTSVILIFVTKTAQYAVGGYAVQALSYLLKPVTMFAVKSEMDRSLAQLDRAERTSILIGPRAAPRRVDISDIVYIESSKHLVRVHTISETQTFNATLQEFDDILSPRGFFRSHSSYLVNFKHVVSIDGEDCMMTNGDAVRISRSRKKGLLEELTNYIGGQLV